MDAVANTSSAFSGIKNVEIVYLVDPDKRTYKGRIKQLATQEQSPNPNASIDIRTVLEDKDVDAVTVATPNHWHSLMTIWACQAGKDVYVEKPCSHNIHEGRIAVAFRQQSTIESCNTAHKTAVSIRGRGLPRLRESGKLGKLLVSRALCAINRANRSA